MSDELKAGDVVRLKSGGPPMTVTEIGEQSFGGGMGVWCEWFDSQHKPQKAVFSPTSVMKLPRNP